MRESLSITEIVNFRISSLENEGDRKYLNDSHATNCQL